MKKALYLIVLAAGMVYAQTPINPEVYNYVPGNEDRAWQDMQIGTVFKDVPINGSPYTEELYKMGIASVNGKKIRLLMRYDAYNDQIEMIDRKQKSFNLLKKKTIEAEFEGKTYKVVEFMDHGEYQPGLRQSTERWPGGIVFQTPERVYPGQETRNRL